jgi:hypothetical protein
MERWCGEEVEGLLFLKILDLKGGGYDVCKLGMWICVVGHCWYRFKIFFGSGMKDGGSEHTHIGILIDCISFTISGFPSLCS